ncbi:hypothetical protein EDD15DRAFT_2366603 [Pisolithus albus]|nr:hypothetical protein EDD15DRAFT_2366603 [Pisolithus albus]
MSYHSPADRSDGLSVVVEEEGLGEEYVVPGSFPWSSPPSPSLVSPSLTSSSSHTLPPASPTLSMSSKQREQLIVLSDSQAATNRVLDRIRHGGEVLQDITEISCALSKGTLKFYSIGREKLRKSLYLTGDTKTFRIGP